MLLRPNSICAGVYRDSAVTSERCIDRGFRREGGQAHILHFCFLHELQLVDWISGRSTVIA
jgi:hypothetical protein